MNKLIKKVRAYRFRKEIDGSHQYPPHNLLQWTQLHSYKKSYWICLGMFLIGKKKKKQ